MLDYILRDRKITVRDLPDLEEFVRSQLGENDKSPQLAKAPPYVRDELLFPYLAGTTFSKRFLRDNSGCADFHKVFENPPVSTQQILHPDLYFSGTKPKPLALPDFSRLVPADWKKLDENVMGEFGVFELLKQFLGEERAKPLSAAWAGDRYAIFEHQKTKQLLLVFRLRLAGDADAARFFGQYSEALELKYDKRRELFRRPNFFSFDTDDGGVLLRCVADECLSVEGTNREAFERITRALGWPPGPAGRPVPGPIPQKTVVTTAVAPGFGAAQLIPLP
jgi:hypothetical protein